MAQPMRASAVARPPASTNSAAFAPQVGLQLAQQFVGLPFEDGARLQSGQKGDGIFDAMEQSRP